MLARRAHTARRAPGVAAYSFPFADDEFDYRPLFAAALNDRLAGRPVEQIASAFHAALATAIVAATETFPADLVVVSGGVFQNALLVESLHAALGKRLHVNSRAAKRRQHLPRPSRDRRRRNRPRDLTAQGGSP